MAEAKNPEILIAQYEYQAAEHGYDSTFRELFPQVSAFASYNEQRDPQPGILDKAKIETVGIRATLSFYDGGATRSKARQAQKEAKRKSYNILDVKRKIRKDMISNLRVYNAAQELTKIYMSEIEASENALNGVREEAKLGQRTILDVLDADEELIDSKISLAQARHDETVTQFSLAATLGILNIQGQ